MLCKECNDSGFVLYEDDRGRTIARACKCRERMLTACRMRASGISKAFLDRTLENYNTSDVPELVKAKKIATDYINSFGTSEHNSVMFLGQAGCGKTHLSFAIGNALLKNKNVSCLYMPYREAITRLKQDVSSSNQEDRRRYEEDMYKYKNAQLLIIDDLYKGNVTDADINYMFQIINHRYLNNSPTITSSEKSIRELMDIDEAIATRLFEQAKGNIAIFKEAKNHRLLR